MCSANRHGPREGISTRVDWSPLDALRGPQCRARPSHHYTATDPRSTNPKARKLGSLSNPLQCPRTRNFRQRLIQATSVSSRMPLERSFDIFQDSFTCSLQIVKAHEKESPSHTGQTGARLSPSGAHGKRGENLLYWQHCTALRAHDPTSTSEARKLGSKEPASMPTDAEVFLCVSGIVELTDATREGFRHFHHSFTCSLQHQRKAHEKESQLYPGRTEACRTPSVAQVDA